VNHALIEQLARETQKLEQAGLCKREVLAQTDTWRDDGGDISHIVNFTATDYLGFVNERRIYEGATGAMDVYGVGMYSPRMVSGTRSIHRELEDELAAFLRTPSAMVYASGYQAAVGLFEPMFDRRDYLFCDEVVHPSIAEGVRLSGARVLSYRSNDLDDLEDKLKRSKGARYRAIVTDGVFSLDGVICKLADLCSLAEAYDALTVLDDSLGVGVLGETGRGTRELTGVLERVSLVMGSLGTVLGGASGGYVAGPIEVTDWLRQKSIPYVFSGALPPAAAGAAKAAISTLKGGRAPLEMLHKRRAKLCSGLDGAGFKVLGGRHPLVVVDVVDSVTLQKMVNDLFQLGICVHGLCYPIVPEGEARIRMHVSVLHTEEDLDQAVVAMETVGKEVGLI